MRIHLLIPEVRELLHEGNEGDLLSVLQEMHPTDAAAILSALQPDEIAQALALFDGLDFVTPDHVQELAVPVPAHRLVLDHEARFSGRTSEAVVGEVLQRVAPPR